MTINHLQGFSLKASGCCYARACFQYSINDFIIIIGKHQGPNKRQETEAARAQPQQAVVPQQLIEPPNKILFLQNVPEDATQEQIVAIFQQFAGFKDVSMVPGRKGIAFVEFQDEIQSGVAMGSLQGFKMTADQALVVSFAKSGY